MNEWLTIHLEKGNIKIMSNVTKEEKNKEVALYNNQQAFIANLEKVAKNSGASYTDYGIKCMVNGYGALLSICNQNKIKLQEFDGSLLRAAFSNIGYTELNFAANECYFDLRKLYEGEGQNKRLVGYAIAVRPQGVGNEKLVRKYGVGVRTLYPCRIIREGDEFTLPSYDGLKMTPPKWIRKSLDGKAIAVVYPVSKVDGSEDYLMASRESVKSNLVAHIRQNMLYKVFGQQRDAKYAELDKDANSMTLDQLLESDKWRDWINPNWLSSSSRESMIIRKMQNNALKNYPKEYDSTAMKEAVQHMIEDYDESLNEPAKNIIDADVVEKVEEEINESPNPDAIQDFQVDNEGVVSEKKVVKEEKEEKEEEKEISLEEDYGF